MDGRPSTVAPRSATWLMSLGSSRPQFVAGSASTHSALAVGAGDQEDWRDLWHRSPAPGGGGGGYGKVDLARGPAVFPWKLSSSRLRLSASRKSVTKRRSCPCCSPRAFSARCRSFLEFSSPRSQTMPPPASLAHCSAACSAARGCAGSSEFHS